MILVCGEALFDVFRGKRDGGGFAAEIRVGGSPLNVAVGLARLNREVGLFTGLSSDWLGDELHAFLTGEGVDTRHLQRIDGPTTLSLVSLNKRQSPSYVFYGDGAADRLIDKRHLPDNLSSVHALHFGSYSAVIEPTATTFERLMVSAGDAVVSYDPNVRHLIEPDLWKWRRRVEFMSGRAALIKISEEDCGLLYGNDDFQSLSDRWLDAGTELVILTKGRKGSVARTRKYEVTLSGRSVEKVGSVGAGDSFQAAILAWLDQRDLLVAGRLSNLSETDLAELLEFAAASAAIVCMRRGADLPRLEELPFS